MNRFHPIRLVIIILLAATGCKVGEPYSRPNFDISEEFHGGSSYRDTLADNGQSLVEIKWEDFFGDPNLVALIDSALVNNLDMQRAVQNIEISRLDFKQSKANMYPSLGVTPLGLSREYASQNFANFGSNRSRNIHDGNPPSTLYTERLSYYSLVTTSWEVDLWGKLRGQKDAALASFMQTEEFKKAVQTALVAEVAATYYTLLKLKAELQVAERNLRLNENTLRIVELQFDAGEATSLAIQQTKSQKLRFQSLIPQIKRNYAIQENKLNYLLGRSPQELEIESELENAVFDNKYSTGVPLELIVNRPDIASSEYALIASHAQVGVAQAMKYPSLSINAGMGMDAYQLSKLANPVESAFAILNGALFQPIFMNGKLKNNHKKALARREIAQLDFKDKLIVAVKEVSDALVTIENLENEYILAEERIETTQKGIMDAALLFRTGFANYLEVNNAQGDALESELNLIDLKMRILLANIDLYRSLGGGWQ
ncbi:efflux transporter outer membrane subunit [Algoriphagus sp. AGSA1]|uniref:efflux transporter outer membrane subunit n=1 Tax=Algoriphagus sp. AGSA1 TaxID=2907213 RepID=UPI001F47B176|nr:efflux transporter outer membrane subunit [Algoriphagus sp. AGSA1]MCE7055879.1 efflux transporter outer membrane subunit [Algoriphagus sp. AGSA1]